MKKTVSLILTVLFVLSMMACSSNIGNNPGGEAPVEGAKTPAAIADNANSANNDTTKDNKDIKVAYLVTDLPHQGWLIISDGVRKSAADLGITLNELTYAADDTVAFLNSFEDAKNMGVDAIIFGAANSEAVPSIEQAVAEGYTCIEIDSPSGAKGTFCLGIDNYAAAKMGGQWVAEKLGGKGTVVVLNGAQIHTSGVDRRSGFIDGVTEGTDIEIFEVDTEWLQEKAMNGIEDALTALNNEVSAVFCAWDGGTVAVASVLEQRGLDDVLLMGFDGAADALQLMREGKIDADVGQPLYGMGYESCKVAMQVIKGELSMADAGNVQLPTIVITPENLEAYLKDAGLENYMAN